LGAALRHAGKYVDIKDTISGFKGVLEGKYDDLPEVWTVFSAHHAGTSHMLHVHLVWWFAL